MLLRVLNFFVFLHKFLPKYGRSSQYNSCFLQFFDALLSRNAFQIFFWIILRLFSLPLVLLECVLILHCISFLKALYIKIWSPSQITFLSTKIATNINVNIPLSLSWITTSGLLSKILLSIWTCWFRNMVTLPSWVGSTNFGTCSYKFSYSNFTPISFHMFKLVENTHTILSLYVLFLPVLGMLIHCGLFSHQIVDIVCICSFCL